MLLSVARSIDRYFRFLDESFAQRLDARAPVAPRVGASPSQTMPTASEGYSPLVVARPLNLSFDGSTTSGIPVGWFNSFGHVSGVSTDYRIDVVSRSAHPGDGTCAVLEKAAAAPGEFGSLMQRCRGRFLAGRIIRLEGELRTDNVTGWAGLWFRADADVHPDLFFDNMSRRPVVGTTRWARYFIDAPLPENTDWLNYGIVLSGAGVLYADNLRLLVWTLDGRWEDV